MTAMKTEPTDARWHITGRSFGNGYGDEIMVREDAEEAVNMAFKEGQLNPKIKQLEWEKDVLFADMIVSDGFSLLFYRINIIDNTLYIGDTMQSFNTLDEAKAAAQNDFQERVEKCIAK